MKGRNTITLIFTYEENNNGIRDTKVVQETKKTLEQYIYASRQNNAFLNKLRIDKRVRIRKPQNDTRFLNYAIYNNVKYKVVSITEDVKSHYYIVEMGEQL